MQITDYFTPDTVNLGPEHWVIISIFVVLMIIAHWKIFTKAGRPGWASLIPIFNVYILLRIAGRPGWWLLLLLIPIVDVVLYIVLMYNLARSFGKGIGYTLLLLLIPVLGQLLLGFGSAKYIGPRTVNYTK